MSEHVLSPAYGRDYKSAAKAIKDYIDGKDFVYEGYGGGGRYCSCRDFINEIVEIRYWKKTKLVLACWEGQNT